MIVLLKHNWFMKFQWSVNNMFEFVPFHCLYQFENMLSLSKVYKITHFLLTWMCCITHSDNEVYWVSYIWYQSQVETLGTNWAQKSYYMFYFGTTCLLTLELCRGGWNIGPKIRTKMTQYLVSSMWDPSM